MAARGNAEGNLHQKWRSVQLTVAGMLATEPVVTCGVLSVVLVPGVPQRCWGRCGLLLAECTCLDVGLARMAARS